MSGCEVFFASAEGCLMDDHRVGEKAFVRYALKIGAFGFPAKGTQLSSGRISPYKFSIEKFHDGATSQRLMAEFADRCMSPAINGEFDAILSIADSTSTLARCLAMQLLVQYQRNIRWGHTRKTPKPTARGPFVGLVVQESDRILLTDDALTTGKSLLDPMEQVVPFGAKVRACLVAMDRKERHDENINETAADAIARMTGVPVYSLFTVDDLLTVLREDGGRDDVVERIKNYQKQYGFSR